MFGGFLGSCEYNCFLSQTGQATFGQLSKKLGLLFISTSGHTAQVKVTFGFIPFIVMKAELLHPSN